MREIERRTIRAAVCAALLSGWAGAAVADDITTSISGYGTLGGTYTGNSAFTFHHNGSEFKTTNSQFDLGLDSRLGVQAELDYGSDLAVIVQEEAKRRGSENFSLGTEWAFLQYAPTSNVKLRFGRVALATFLMSDSRDVGYSQPWFDAPNELYSSEPFSFLDGAQALWHVNTGPVGLGLEAEYGTTNQTEQTSGQLLPISAKSAYNVAASLTYGNVLVRIAETSVTFPLTLPLGPTTVVNYSDHDKFLSAGIQYDDGRAIVLGEWAKRNENNVQIVNLPLSIAKVWYLAAGWHFGKLTPLLMYGKVDGGQSLVAPAGTDTTWSATLRYDIVRNIALKAQFLRPQVSNLNYFMSPNFASNERVSVLSLGADFVF